MRQLGRGFDLTLKSSQGHFGFRVVGVQQLHDHDPLHAAMFRLEDFAHAAAADAVDDHVVTQNQAVRTALADPGSLVMGELSLADQFTG